MNQLFFLDNRIHKSKYLLKLSIRFQNHEFVLT
jgi:hypothetical protein